MKVRRREDEIVTMQRDLATKLVTERTRIMNKWKRLRPTLRSHGKKANKRHAAGVLVTLLRTQQSSESRVMASRVQLADKLVCSVDERCFRFQITESQAHTA